MNWKVFHRRLRIVWVSAGLLFTLWMVWNMQAHGVPAETWVSSATVTVSEHDGATVFMPGGLNAERPALVFLPGGGVDPAAYGPIVRAVADAGWPAALVRLPWRLAFSEAAEAQVWARVVGVRDAWGSERPIVIGGHSRGASIAARFAYRHHPALAGLLMVGTTHPRDHDLSALTFPVMKVSGTRDCVADGDASRANQSLLPSHTAWVSIEGANHAQFGSYGSQLGDCRATLSRAEQQRELLGAMVSWLSGLSL
jgi:pimeloyl-ACP methyl ester carboxylesterase